VSSSLVAASHNTRLEETEANHERNAYVDARIGRLLGDAQDDSSAHNTLSATSSAISGTTAPASRQPVGMGKLHEVDLGPDAARLNALRTQEAAARLNNTGLASPAPQPEPRHANRRGRPFPGRGGKFRRKIKRRTSDDLKRDQMVEAILAESNRMCFRFDPDLIALRC
jgi:hypothetical protein